MNKHELIKRLFSIEVDLLDIDATEISAPTINRWIYDLAGKLMDVRIALAKEACPAHPVTPPATKRKYAMPRGDILAELEALEIEIEDVEANLQSTMDRISNLKIDAITTK
jgi:hypothetical protein